MNMIPNHFRPFFVEIVMTGTWPAIGSKAIAIFPIGLIEVLIGLFNITDCTVFHYVLNVRFVPFVYILL
jgi:hypothetical protein